MDWLEALAQVMDSLTPFLIGLILGMLLGRWAGYPDDEEE